MNKPFRKAEKNGYFGYCYKTTTKLASMAPVQPKRSNCKTFQTHLAGIGNRLLPAGFFSENTGNPARLFRHWMKFFVES